MLNQADSLQLLHRALVPRSEQIVISDSILTVNVDYTADYPDGVIRFNVRRNGLARVSYRYLPETLPTVYRRFALVWQDSARTPDSSLPQTLPPAKGWFDEADLTVGGSKTVSIDVGSQRDLSLEQSLRVSITGRVTPTVSVIALLTDENTPIQPEGDTRELAELDKVLIQIQSPHLQGTLGDFDLITTSVLTGFQRDLQGVRGDWQQAGNEATVALAVSRGEYHSNVFFGQEGIQGPYPLTAKDGSDDLVILAGTEEVWLNGEKLRRGETGDYVIDYAAAKITFTTHRPITAQSRLVVDFQYANQAYNRNFYAASFHAPLFRERLRLGVRLLHEGDNRSRPIELTLSAIDKTALTLAGDAVRRAYRDGATQAVGTEGEYDRVTDAQTGAVYYVYVAADSAGDYNVRFSYVGPGLGDYRRSAVGIYYEYVGPGLGDFVAVTFLPLPRQQQMVGLDAAWQAGAFSLKGEAAFSRLDLNTFSDFDDGDNSGQAVLLESALKATPTRFGQIAWNGKGRYRSRYFVAPGRLNAAEYDRRWNLSPGDSVRAAAESAYETNLTWQPLDMLKFNGFYGETRRGSAQRATLWNFGASLAQARWPEISAHVEGNRSRIDGVTTDRQTYHFGLIYETDRLKTEAIYHHQKTARQQADGNPAQSVIDDAYRAATVSILSKKLRKWSLTGDFSYRQDDFFDMARAAWRKQGTAYNQTYRFGLAGWRAFTLQGEIHQRAVQSATGEDNSTQLIEFKARYQPAQRLWNILGDYRVTNTARQRQAETYIFVGENRGDYSYDALSGLYFQDPTGDYRRRIDDVGLPEQTINLSGSLRLQYHPYRQKSGPAWTRLLKSETWLRIEEETREDDKLAVYLLNWSKFQRDAVTIRGRLLLEQIVTLFPSSRRGSLDAAYRYQDDEINQYVSRHEEKATRQYRLEGRLTARATWTVSLKALLETAQERVRERLESSRLNRRQFTADAMNRPSMRWEYGGQVGYENSTIRDNAAPADLNSWTLKPMLTYAPTRQSRWQGWLSWQRTTITPDDGNLPYSLRGLYKAGNVLGWDVRLEYRMFGYLQMSLHYSGRKEPGEAVFHAGQMQAQAVF